MSTTSLSLSRQGLPLRTAHNLLNRQRLSKSRAFVAAAPRAEAAPQAEPAVPHEQQQLAAQAPPEPRAVMPRAFSPLATSSFGRMQQVMADMDREMAMLGRAFGVPLPRVGMPPLASLFSDLPDWVAAPDLPAPAAIPLAVDARDAGDALHVTADVPGVPAEGLKVELSPDRVLTISGERSSEQRSGSKEEGTLRVERSFGTFIRRLRLPEGVDVEGIKAAAKDGVLTITIPKAPQPQPVHIPVEAAAAPAPAEGQEQAEEGPAAEKPAADAE